MPANPVEPAARCPGADPVHYGRRRLQYPEECGCGSVGDDRAITTGQRGGLHPSLLVPSRGPGPADPAEAGVEVARGEATGELTRDLLERNELEPEAMVSCLFTTTDDLDAEFPAVAARELGLEAVPLLCCREIRVPGSMPRVIRAMVHYYAPVGHAASHAYLGATQDLRPDLHAAQ